MIRATKSISYKKKQEGFGFIQQKKKAEKRYDCCLKIYGEEVKSKEDTELFQKNSTKRGRNGR